MKRQYKWIVATIIVIATIVAVAFSIRLPKTKQRMRMEADSLMVQSVRALDVDSFTLAFHNLRQALSLYLDLKDKGNEMNVRTNMAVVYYGIGLHDEAIKELNIVGRNVDVLSYDSRLMYHRCRAIMETTANENYGVAIENIKTVIALERERNNNVAMVQDMANMAEIYIYAGRVDKSRSVIEEINHINDSLGFAFSSQYYLCLGKIHFAEGNYNDAYNAFSQCTYEQTHYYQPHLKLEALGIMCEIDSMRNDKDRYISNLKSHISLNDSLSGSQITSRIARLQEQQRMEIARADADKRNKLMLAYLISGLAIALLMAVISFLMYRQSKSRQHLLQLETDKLDGEIMLQRMQNELLELKVNKHNEELKEVRQENLSMSLQLASMTEKKSSDTLQTFDGIYRGLNKNFVEELRRRHPNLTNTEERFLCLIKLGMTSGEMMSVLNISQSGIYKMRYRLKKKLGLSTEDTIENYLTSVSG